MCIRDRSIGVQSFDDGLLSFLGRVHSSSQAKRAVELAQIRFDNVSIDLMCGLPGQTEEGFRNDLELALQLGVKHVSVYPLMVEEGTPLFQRVEKMCIRDSCIVLWLAWPRAFPTRAIVSICVALLLCIVPMRMFDANSTSIVMLDVGQGDSFLVKSRGLTLLIDTGNNPRKLLAGLARHRVNHLDGVDVYKRQT